MTDDDQAPAEGDEVDPAAVDDAEATDEEAFDDPDPEQSLVPPDAVRPLANAVVFVVVWSALLLYVGRDPVQAVGLGLVGGGIYFVASYYVLS